MIKNIFENRWRIAVVGFPVCCLLYGIGVYVFPQLNLFEFNKGLAIELVGFAITVLFFDLVVLRQHEASRQQRDEDANNRKIHSVLSSDNIELKFTISTSIFDHLAAEEGDMLPAWDVELTPELCAVALAKNYFFHVAPTADQQRGFSGVIDGYKTSQRHLSAFLPTVATATEMGEAFEDILIQAFSMEREVNKALNSLLHAVNISDNLEAWLATPNAHPDNIAFVNVRKYYSAIRQYALEIDKLLV